MNGSMSILIVPPNFGEAAVFCVTELYISNLDINSYVH